MTVKGISEEELALLSDAEREALEEGDEQDAVDVKALKKIAEGADGGEGEPGPGDEKDDDDDAETADQKAAREKAEAKEVKDAAAEKSAREAELKAMSEEDRVKAEAADKAKAEEAEKAKVKAEGEPDPDAEENAIVRPRLPRYDVKLVEKYDEQMKGLDDADNAAQAKFDEGEMELKALLAEQRKNSNARAELRDAKVRADMATDFNAKATKTEWMGDVQDFFVSVKAAEGIDYNKKFLNIAFDAALKSLAADKANADRSPTWFLRNAHKAVKDDIGWVGPPDKDDAAAKAKAEKEAADKAKLTGRPPKLAAVPGIGALPNAGEDDAAGGNPEFAALDKLEGIEYEDALAAMPKSKQDLYLRQQRA